MIDHIASGGQVVAHNAGFERRVWNYVLNRMFGWCLPMMQIEQMDCTAARCRVLGLPGDLERAARVVRAPYQKDTTGGDTMKKMAKPRRVHFHSEYASRVWANGLCPMELLHEGLQHSEVRVGPAADDRATIDWWYDETFYRPTQTSYCITDVLAETGVDVVVPPLSPKELAIYRLNEKINDRGFPIDVPLIKKVDAILDLSAARANNRMWTITGGKVKKCSEHAKLKTWLDGRGVKAFVIDKSGKERQSVAKGATDDLIVAAKSTTDLAALEAIELHAGNAKVSYAGKVGSALDFMNVDGRIRGPFMYHTAPTGRFSAVGWQAHNLERVDEERELPMLRELIKVCERFEVEYATNTIDLVTNSKTASWMSKMSRPIIRAGQGKIFRGADLSNIEGRVNAWLAGEDWKIQAFNAFDNKTGPDLYKVTAGNLLNKPPAEITKGERQSYGKVPDLAGGYQGAVMAYVSMGNNLGVSPEDIADTAAAVTDPKVWAATAKAYRLRFSCGLEQSVWTGIKVVVNAWRDRHPKIVQSWWDRQDAAIAAVANPGEITSACDGKIRYLCQYGFLTCMLPSNKAISYPSPEIVRVKYIREEKQVIDGIEVLVEVEAYKNAVQTWGIEKGQWVPYTLYGGIQCENETQGLSRDVFADCGLDLDALGYNLVFHCHDEYLSEDDPSFGSTQEMVAVLSRPRSYAPGLPLAAAAWEDERYVK